MAFQRVVCFKFKANTGEVERKMHMDDFGDLKNKIPEILSYSAGYTIAGDYGIAPEYDVMHYLTFNSEKDIDTYFTHKEHQVFIERNKAAWEKVLVINSAIAG